MSALRLAPVGASAISSSRKANHSTSCCSIWSQGGLPITASKPPTGSSSCQRRQTPGKATSQCRKPSRSAISLAVAPHCGEGGPEAALPDLVCGIDAVGAFRQQRKGLFLLRDDCPHQRRLEFVALLLFHAGGQPVYAAKCVEQTAQISRRLLDLAETVWPTPRPRRCRSRTSLRSVACPRLRFRRPGWR